MAIILIVSTYFLGSAAGKPPLVYRTILPDTRPSSIAVGYDNDISFVFDPVRGGISYIWTGPFLDLKPTWTGKLIQPARILGQVFFRDATELPLRKGDPVVEPEFTFDGYDVDSDRITFYYRLEGSNIRQTVSALKEEQGLEIQFEVSDPEEIYWLLLSPQADALVSSPAAERIENCLRFRGKKTYTVEIRHE